MEGPNQSLSLTFQMRGGCALWELRLPRTPQLQSPHFFYQELLPLPHLAIYCCNLLTSKMLHNRPHLGQGGSPGLPLHLAGPCGARC